MKGNLLMERWKGKELKPGLMETDLKECGKMINNMVLVSSSAKKLGISARAFHRTIKLSRTIADLDKSDEITENHILEALQYRQKGF